MAFLRDTAGYKQSPLSYNEEEDNGREDVVKAISTVGKFGSKILKGINQANESKLADLGYLSSVDFTTPKGEAILAPHSGNKNWLQKTFRGPEDRVKISKQGMEYFGDLASENNTNIVEEYMSFMDNQNISQQNMMDIAKGSFDKTDVIENIDMLKTQHVAPDWSGRDLISSEGYFQKPDFFTGEGFGMDKPSLNPFSNVGLDVGNKVGFDRIITDKVGMQAPNFINPIGSQFPGMNALPFPPGPAPGSFGALKQGVGGMINQGGNILSKVLPGELGGLTQGIGAIAPGLATAVPVVGALKVLGDLFDWW